MACFSLVTHVVFISLEKKTPDAVLKNPYPHLGRLPTAQAYRSASAGNDSFQHLSQLPNEKTSYTLAFLPLKTFRY